MKFVPTVFSARQFVNHGHVKVNGRRVNIPSFLVRDGDVVEVRDRSRDIPMVIEATQSGERDVPDYLSVDHDKLKGTFIRAPQFADVPIRSDGTEPGASSTTRDNFLRLQS